MKLIIQKDRKAIPVGTYGTQNENEVTELTLKIPEEYQNWNKRIVFLTSEGNFWDYIQDDTYTIKNNITKFTSVRAYIWLTNDEQDFRTKEFTLSFWDNRNADNLIPTAEQIDGFNTLITTLNLEITTVTDLETELNGIITDLQYKLDTDYFKGEKGEDGVDGQDGKSAYEIWLDEGNVGTEEDFLESLKGADGQDGINGTNGRDGVNGTNGQDGYTPVKGTDYWTNADKAEMVQDTIQGLQPTLSSNLQSAKDYTDNQITRDFKDISYDNTTATFVFTRHDNTTFTVDLPIEQTVKNGYYDDTTEELVLVLVSEQEIRIPASGLIDDYSGQTSATIQVSISADNKITCNIVSGSISKTLLTTELQTELNNKATKEYVDNLFNSIIDGDEVSY